MRTVSNDADDQVSARLAALAEYAILDTPAELSFDDIAFIASHACGTPVALVSLVDRDRQWFKAKVGLEACETPLGQSVCAHALGQTAILEIPDLTTDDRTSDNPLVVKEPKIRFYAGAPLVTPAGVVIGTLCVIDMTPRPGGLTTDQSRVLEGLARQVVAQLELGLELRQRLARAELSEEELLTLKTNAARVRMAQEAGEIGTFELDLATDTMSVSVEFCRLFGLPVAATYPAHMLEAIVLWEDTNVRSDLASRADGSASVDVEYRIRRPSDGRLRWIGRRSRFHKDATGKVTKMFGVVRDVTDRKKLQEHQCALLQLGDLLRDAATEAEIVAIATRITGDILSVSRAGYATIDAPDGTLHVALDWTAPNVASLTGQYPLSRFPATIGRLSRGETITVASVGAADWLTREADNFRNFGIRAEVKVPLVEGGQLVGLLFVHQSEPRTWTSDEVNFIHGVADRTHAAISKARAEAEQRVLNQELSHRLKNTLAMVQAIAAQTLRSIPEREPVDTLEKRIHALSAAHDVLVQQSWSAARITAIVDTVLEAFGHKDRFEISGTDLNLGPRVTLSLSMVLHELATNALKYGALSDSKGRIELSWRVEGVGPAASFVIDWKERDGPSVAPPSRNGFGSRLIRLGLVGTGGVELRYQPTGLHAEMRAPLLQMQQS